MRTLARSIAAAIAIAVAVGPAAATQFTYVFNSNTYGTNTWSTSGSNAGVLQGGGTDPGLTVTTAAFTAVRSGATDVNLTTASVVAYDGGLGVVGSYDNYNFCGVGGCGMHQIDNVGNASNTTAYDFIQLTFSRAVTLVGMSRIAYPQTQNTTATTDDVWDDDASWGRGGTQADALLKLNTRPAAITGAGTTNWSTFSSMLNNTLLSGSNATSSTGSCVKNLVSGSTPLCYDSSTWGTTSNIYTASTTWWVSAAILNPDNKTDAFKLYDFKVVYSDAPGVVPEPASWMTMIAGFGFIGAALRRRKAAERLAAA